MGRRVRIQHTTRYEFGEPVSLGPHRLMLRPREGRELRVLSHDVVVTPDAQLSWGGDVFGNVVGTAHFGQRADRIVISSQSDIELTNTQWPVFSITASAAQYPFAYAQDEQLDFGALRMPQYADTQGQLASWARGFILGHPADTLCLLRDLNSGVQQRIRYQSREEEGTQGPLDTITRGYGSCRDFSVLFAESVRALGFAARIVSGYLYDADRQLVGSCEQGSTHAWVDVFVPEAGWIAFDPTNGSVGGYNLIPVAVGRRIEQLTPVAGSFFGLSGASLDVTVTVSGA